MSNNRFVVALTLTLLGLGLATSVFRAVPGPAEPVSRRRRLGAAARRRQMGAVGDVDVDPDGQHSGP